MKFKGCECHMVMNINFSGGVYIYIHIKIKNKFKKKTFWGCLCEFINFQGLYAKNLRSCQEDKGFSSVCSDDSRWPVILAGDHRSHRTSSPQRALPGDLGHRSQVFGSLPSHPVSQRRPWCSLTSSPLHVPMQRTIRPVRSSCASSALPHRRFPPRTLGFPTFRYESPLP